MHVVGTGPGRESDLSLEVSNLRMGPNKRPFVDGESTAIVSVDGKDIVTVLADKVLAVEKDAPRGIAGAAVEGRYRFCS